MGIDTRFDIINGRFYLFVPGTQLSKREDEQKGNGTSIVLYQKSKR